MSGTDSPRSVPPTPAQELLNTLVWEKQAIFSQYGSEYAPIKKWYQDNNARFDTILRTEGFDNHEDVCQIIESLPKIRFSRELAKAVIQYLETLPPEFLADHPKAAFSKAAMYLNNRNLPHAKKLFLEIIENFGQENNTPAEKEIAGEAYIMLGTIGMTQYDRDFADFFQKAEPLLPHGSTFWNRTMYFADNCDIFFLPDGNPGALDSIVDTFKETMPRASKLMNGCGHGAELLFEAEAAYYSGNFQDVFPLAHSTITKSIQENQMDIAANAQMLIMKSTLLAGEPEEAEQELLTLENSIEGHDHPSLLLILDCAQGWLYEKTGEVEKIPLWIRGAGLRNVVLPPASVGRPRLIHGALLLRQKKYTELFTLLDILEPYFQSKGFWSSYLKTLILRSTGLLKIEKTDAALQYLWRALELSYHNHIVTPFIELGDASLSLVRYALQIPSFHFILDFLEEIIQKSTHCSQAIETFRHRENQEAVRYAGLTKEEMKVLELLVQGANNDDICNKLSYSLSHVKQLTRNLYRKLSANSKADALSTASAMGIIM